MGAGSTPRREHLTAERPIGQIPELPPETRRALAALGIEEPAAAARNLAREIGELGLTRNVAELEESGYTIVEDAAPAGLFERIRQRIVEAAAEDRARGIQTLGGTRGGATGQTVFHLLSRGRVFEEAVLQPKVVALMMHLLGRGYTVSTLTGMVRPSGGPPLPLHSDNQYMPQPFPPYSQLAVAIWCCEDFTEAAGATRIVPGSHRLLRHPKPGEGDDRAIPIECPRGSIVVWGSNTWHGNCGRTLPGERVTLHTAFCRPHLRPMESYESIPDEVVERNPPLFAQLIGRGLPYGFDEAGPDPADMLRATILGLS